MLKKKTDFITKIETTELIDATIREAVGQQARDLEKHLTDIDKRLRQLEKRRK
jgi:hypothetical protein